MKEFNGEFKEFSGSDEACYAGAEDFADGRKPRICDTDNGAVILCRQGIQIITVDGELHLDVGREYKRRWHGASVELLQSMAQTLPKDLDLDDLTAMGFIQL